MTKTNKRDRELESEKLSPEQKRQRSRMLTLEDLDKLRTQISGDMDVKLKPLFEKVNKVEHSVEMLESKLKKNNIIVFGLPETQNENFDNLCHSLDELWKVLGVSGLLIDNFYRLGQPKAGWNRPILIQFVRYLDKRQVMMNKHKVLKNKIFVNDDLTKAEQGSQRVLRAKLQELKQQDNNITGSIRGHSLLIKSDGKVVDKFIVVGGVIKQA